MCASEDATEREAKKRAMNSKLHFIRSDGVVSIPLFTTLTCDPLSSCQTDVTKVCIMCGASGFPLLCGSVVLLLLRVRAEQVLMGYLTGSQRRPGDNIYPRPGQTISGAISYAVDEINEKHPIVENHTLGFVVAETFGDEEESIKQTATLWTAGRVAVYIGPQESCIHEARMAASFNLPMISYVSAHFSGAE